MLYKDGLIEKEKNDFLFEAKPYNDDIDLKEIAAIQVFYEKNGYIPEKYISSFLNWVTYMTRLNITSPLESVMDLSMAGRCAIAQNYLSQLFSKFNLSHIPFNVGMVVGTDPIHALTKVIIPTAVDGETCLKEFILDPTFRQFCLTEENRFERYNEEKRWAVDMATPHPGYFFNLTDEGRDFANNLICYGYYEATDENLKKYFDAFALYVTPKEKYEDSSLLGKIHSTNLSGDDYRQRINNGTRELVYSSRQFDFTTPKEEFDYEQSRFINRIKHRFKKSDLDSLFVITDEPAEVTSHITK